MEGPHTCRECGNELPAGGRFCNQCGVPASLPAASALNQQEPAPAPRPSSATLPWVIAAGALIALLAVVLVPRFRGEETAPQAVSGPPITGTPGDPTRIDLASMTPREAADRLFNRVMQNVSSGDSAQARQFLPMALMAYERVPELDLDGRYHVALLHLVNGDPRAARAQADSILSAEPNHLFGLFAAAQAEQALGDEAAARELFQRFLANFDSEVDRDLPEYRDHAPTLPVLREEAQRAVQ